MLCLTVYEAKGLEFDDVILLNFFHHGDVVTSQWKLLNDLYYSTVRRIKPREDLDSVFIDFDDLDALKKAVKEAEKRLEQEDATEDDFYEETEINLKRSR